MTDFRRPTKQQVREYMERRTLREDPPPSPEEIRRQLGWDLIPANRQPDRDEQD